MTSSSSSSFRALVFMSGKNNTSSVLVLMIKILSSSDPYILFIGSTLYLSSLICKKPLAVARYFESLSLLITARSVAFPPLFLVAERSYLSFSLRIMDPLNIERQLSLAQFTCLFSTSANNFLVIFLPVLEKTGISKLFSKPGIFQPLCPGSYSFSSSSSFSSSRICKALLFHYSRNEEL